MDKIIPDTFYHIYNRGNNKQKIFFRQSNYIYFLNNLQKYLSDFACLYAYCLLPNHFHLIIKTAAEEKLLKMIEKHKPESNFSEPGNIISEQFRLMFMSYTKAINKQEKREGSLLRKYFKHKAITSDEYLIRSILYTHMNPVHHKITYDFRTYMWSSYNKILNTERSYLCKEKILELFGNIENYKEVHYEESLLYTC
jgi:REP element-mobilizing transposase RayT